MKVPFTEATPGLFLFSCQKNARLISVREEVWGQSMLNSEWMHLSMPRIRMSDSEPVVSRKGIHVIALYDEQLWNFLIWPKYCILDSFINYEGYSISSKGSLPTVVGIMVIGINSPIPIHFSSLMPKMLMFTLAISFLKMSNLPWFLDLTFQVLCSVVLYSIRHVFTIKHIHNWLLFPLWPSPFILSGAISNCPLVFPSSILVTFWPWAPLLGS